MCTIYHGVVVDLTDIRRDNMLVDELVFDAD